MSMLKKRCHSPACTNMYVNGVHGCCRMSRGRSARSTHSPSTASVRKNTTTLAARSRVTQNVMPSCCSARARGRTRSAGLATALGEQSRGETLPLGDALDLDRDRIDAGLETTESFFDTVKVHRRLTAPVQASRDDAHERKPEDRDHDCGENHPHQAQNELFLG